MAQLLFSTSRHQRKAHPQWSLDAVIYEMNVRQFTPEGDFLAATTHLPRLKSLGVDIIWLMPIFPIGKERRKGELGSYYSIADYTKVNPEFGDMDDFVAFVDTAHTLGIKIIVDWVANHTSRDAEWTKKHPQWYMWDIEKGEFQTPFDWHDTAKLNYDNQDMRKEMIRSLKFWIEKTGIDGYRMDMAMLVPDDFWWDALGELMNISKDLFFLAEAEGPQFHRLGFDATYGWEMHHLMNRIARGEANADSLCELISREATIYSSNSIRMHFTSNHDENSWNGTEFERMGAYVYQMAALSYILPGMPLIYSGQECESRKSLEFFDKDSILWSNGSYAEVLYTELSKLKHSHPALKAGNSGGDLERIDCSEPWRVLALKRKVGDSVVIALFNLSQEEGRIRFWDADFCGQYSQIGNPEKAYLHEGSEFYLAPNQFFIYYK